MSLLHRSRNETATGRVGEEGHQAEEKGWRVSDPASTLVIVGVGPRGVSLLERIAARGDRALDVHLVDDSEPGAGRLWRTDQDRDMCMNTLAGAVTLFTDASFSGAGPVRLGPTLYEWCRLVHERATGEVVDVPEAHRRVFEDGADVDAILADPGFRAEVATTGPGSHPSRALYGHYLRWVLDTTIAGLGPSIRLHWHHTLATRVRVDDGARPLVELADGTELPADAVVLATGWLPSASSLADQELAAAVEHVGGDLLWVQPDSPIDQDLSGIRGGEPVIVRGLGMGFFDSMSMLTIGRGGHFEAVGDGLRYVPSGDEPVMHVGSRRGLPFRAKSVHDGLPPATTLARVRAVDWSSRLPLRFTEDFFPLLARDATEAYYACAAQQFPLDLAKIVAVIDVTEPWELARAVAPLLPDDLAPFDLYGMLHERVAPQDHDDFQGFIRDRVAADLVEAGRGPDSALKAGLWEANASRRFVTELTGFDGSTAEGYDGDLREFLSFGGTIGSGPPAFRAAQLLALMDAGLVHFLGPETTVEAQSRPSDDEGRGGGATFVAHSPAIAGLRVEARVLLDAWLRLHDGRRTRDPIIAGLLEDGLAEPFGRRNSHGSRTPGPGLRIDEVTSELIGPRGRHRIHLVGIPSDAVRGDTVISPMPGTDPTMLREMDAVAEALLG